MLDSFMIFLLLAPLVSLIACEKEPPPQTFQAHGVVESVEKEQGSITIAHDEIPDFMQAMTMKFEVPHPIMLKNIQPGDEVNFSLMLARDGLYLMTIEPVAEKSGERQAKSVAGVVSARHSRPGI
jgi:protein SCO1/2